MRRVSIAQAKQTLPALVHQAEREGEIELTRRGRPVAYLVSADRHAALPRRTFVAAFEAWREKYAADVGDDELELRRRQPPRKPNLAP